MDSVLVIASSLSLTVWATAIVQEPVVSEVGVFQSLMTAALSVSVRWAPGRKYPSCGRTMRSWVVVLVDVVKPFVVKVAAPKFFGDAS